MSTNDETLENGGFQCPTPLPVFTNLNHIQETVIVLCVFCYIGGMTKAFLALYDKLDDSFPKYWNAIKKLWPLLGLAPYLVVGVMMHILDPLPTTCIIPPNGTWGWWYMPFGSNLLIHVYWTGIVEIVGGASLLYGGFSKEPWSTELLQSACWMLFYLTLGMTFAHAYQMTHGTLNFVMDEDMPKSRVFLIHSIRNTIQALWLSNLFYMATKESLTTAAVKKKKE